MEWEQIHTQQENGKWHDILKVLQKNLPRRPVIARNRHNHPLNLTELRVEQIKVIIRRQDTGQERKGCSA